MYHSPGGYSVPRGGGGGCVEVAVSREGREGRQAAVGVQRAEAQAG